MGQCFDSVLSFALRTQRLFAEAASFCYDCRIINVSPRLLSLFFNVVSHTFYAASTHGPCHEHCQVFDPLFNQWRNLPDMTARRDSLGLAVMDNKLYAVGGRDGRQALASAEVFDPVSGAWARLPPVDAH